ncbi:hypothetical protein [Nonomuraea sp. NPDC050643]|uniref:hypothetical protein n=1 Tax=Nonomuraea sp. NPDC050643 TaxID=3155660 RepID=UPI0033E25C9B
MRTILVALATALAALMASSPASAAAAEEQFVCGYTPTPAGWTITAWTHNPSCGSGPLDPNYNYKRITRVDNLPIGSTLVMCVWQNVPPGWTASYGINTSACQATGQSPNGVVINRSSCGSTCRAGGPRVMGSTPALVRALDHR